MAESKALELVELLRPLGLEAALRVARAAWRQLSIEEQALITADWPFWFRQKQFAPAGDWRTWGFLGARGLGKTTSLAWFVNQEVEAGRARLLGICAQDEQSSIDIQINGPDGLIATAPPWFKPVFEASAFRVVWPNGAYALMRTPEVPGKIRGPQYDLYWASELQSWPQKTREEAWDMIELSTRVGHARILWDASPKKRHPLLTARLAEAAADPRLHRVVRGATAENAANLNDAYYATLRKKYEGTTRGREELGGEMLEDSELALFKQDTIEKNRRPMPARFLRKVVSIDPSVTNKKGSDICGVVEVGLGADGIAYPLKDASHKHLPDRWIDIALDWYLNDDCDLVIAETNKGGSLVATTLRAIGKLRGLEIVVVDKNAPLPQRQAGKVFILEVYARGAKEDRAEPVATAYERGRVSHPHGADLSSLEDTLTTWEPAPNADSPGDLDALVHACVELLELSKNEPDRKKQFAALPEMADKLAVPTPAAQVSLSKASQAITTALNHFADRI